MINTKNGIARLILLFPSFLFLFSCGSKKEEDKKATGQQQQGPIPVSAIIIAPGKLSNSIRSSGTVIAFESVDLAAETSGRIEKIYFNEGTHVNKGELLVKINDDDLQAELKKGESQVQLLSQQEQRQKELLNIQASSQQDYDNMVNQLNAAKADKEAILAAIRKTEIKSPFNGVIGLRYVSEGSYVNSQTRIASVQNINTLKVDFSIPEKYADQVKMNDPVHLSNDETNQEYNGKVFAIEPRIDAGTRTMQVRALIENKSEKIFPGSFANIDLQLKEIPDAILVPTQAITPVLKGQSVFIIKNGKAKSTMVKTGIRQPDKVQVTGGLQGGDTLIVTGVQQLRNDSPVRAIVK